MNLKILYKDNDILAIDKPAGIVVFPEGDFSGEKTVIDYLIEQKPELKATGEAPRYGVVHRLDKDTSGVLLVAKTPEALIFLQKQFSAGAKALVGMRDFPALREIPSSDKKNKEPLAKTVEKRYIALVCGRLKEDSGTLHTMIGRAKSDPRKQAAHSLEYSGKTGLREAITDYKVLQRFADYTLLEVQIKTGRKHQIRCHMAYIHHPIAGDKLYGFKDSPTPTGLERQFLHASYLKIQLPNGTIQELHSELPEDLKQILNSLKS